MTPFTTRIDAGAALCPRGRFAGLIGVFDGQGSKRRPVLLVHDFGDADLLVVPITSHPVRTATDVSVPRWQDAGLKLPSTVRVEKLATIEKICVTQKLGKLSAADLTKVRETLAVIRRQILS